jgi:hypothetical protein
LKESLRSVFQKIVLDFLERFSGNRISILRGCSETKGARLSAM